MGCYNLYSMWPDAFAEPDRGQLEMFAANAAGAVAVAVKLADQTQMSEDLHGALASRAVIDQATEIIMAQQRCGAAAAFDILRRASQNVMSRSLIWRLRLSALSAVRHQSRALSNSAALDRRSWLPGLSATLGLGRALRYRLSHRGGARYQLVCQGGLQGTQHQWSVGHQPQCHPLGAGLLGDFDQQADATRRQK